jgi:hypothetical protein
MPEPNTHIAAGLGISWLGAKLVGLDTDYLIVGMVGCLLAAARAEPEPFCYAGYAAQGRQIFRAVANLLAVSFFAAALTSIVVLLFPAVRQIGIPITFMAGFFGYHLLNPLIKAGIEFTSNLWRVALKRLGGSDADIH